MVLTLRPVETGEKLFLVIYIDLGYNAMGGIKWIDSKEFSMSKYTCDNSKGCVLEFLQYPK